MPTYKTIHTRYGLIAMASAEAAKVPINLPTMAVGDGNGNFVTPDAEQTELVRERYRGPVNLVYQDPDNPLRFTAEMVIPASIAGFTLREGCVIDADGSLFVVCNLPATYKPTAEEGAYSDSIVRIEFMVANADVVTIQIDPNVAVATQTWITNNITAAFMLPGGTTGQVLTKKSNADGDTVWADPDVASVVVDTIEETQTLALDQVIVDLAVCTTRGLAVYIAGERLRADQWTKDPVLNTRLTLAVSYPAGTKIIAAQNEPTGNAPAPLERSKNLSDVEDAATSRDNLGVYSKAEVDALLDRAAPVGKFAWFDEVVAPAGWLKRNGAAVSRTAYARLFAKIGTRYGAGDGFNTFNLPDSRGEFVRCLDDGRGINPGRTIGSLEMDALQGHQHRVLATVQSGGQYTQWNGSVGNFATGSVETAMIAKNMESDGTNGVPRISNETRPRNIALLACIKF